MYEKKWKNQCNCIMVVHIVYHYSALYEHLKVTQMLNMAGKWKNTWNIMGMKDLLNAVFATRDFI